jgi:hypothetical protein
VIERILRTSPVIDELLDRLPNLLPPDWWLASGAVFQTVWNHQTGRPPEHGIRDHDVVYWDADTSWEAEDAVIRRLADLPGAVEARNQARVHLWFEERFGTPCPPIGSAAEGIDRFPAACCCVGVRPGEVYAPYGLDDVFAMVVRPNPVIVTQEVYEAKAARWKALWPEATVMAWDHRPAAG